MTQQIPPYSDERYPPYSYIRETENLAHEVQKCRDARCWNETDKTFHER